MSNSHFHENNLFENYIAIVKRNSKSSKFNPDFITPT